MGYKKDIIRGLSWLGAFRVTTRAMSFVRTLIIARLLSPYDFGVFGIITIILSITEIVTETGINIFLIQKKDEIDDYIDTAWVVSIIRGVIISVSILLTASFVANFFNISSSYNLILLSSLIPIFRGFINPSVAKFLKDLKFHKEFIYRTSVFFVESVTSLILVYIFHSIVGLVCGLLIGAIYESIFTLYFAKPMPKLHFKKAKFLEVINKGKWITASGIFNYLYQNLDTVIVGKFLGTSQLGIYDMSYTISSLPISEFSDVISQSTFPVFMKISDQKKRLLRAYLLTTGLTILLVIPVAIIFFFFPTQVIGLILGKQWLAGAEALKILAMYGCLRAVLNISNAVFYTLHRQDIVTKMTLVSFIFMLSSILLLIRPYGLVGASIAALIGTLSAYPIMIYYIFKFFYAQPAK